MHDLQAAKGAQLMPYQQKVNWACRSLQIGWYATRQAVLRRGGSLLDVAEVLVLSLRLQAPAIRNSK